MVDVLDDSDVARQPLVSVITVTRNAEQFLEQSIASVIGQSYPNIEYLIIDGLSDDSTIEIIKKFESHVDYWVSEADSSMYDAINKAIMRCTGDIVAILNADDRYADPDVIARVVDATSGAGAEGIYGDLIVDYGDRMQYKKVFQVSYDEFLLSGKGTFVPHPTLFLKRRFIDAVGLYNLNYKYASDFDFILRCLSKLKLHYCGFPITIFRRHQGSITASGKIKEERKEILNDYRGSHHLPWHKRFIKAWLWFKYYSLNVARSLFNPSWNSR
jgi:glycosyltransferase involved in cell wall biosynthesis